MTMKRTNMTNKRTYIAPSLQAYKVSPATIMAASASIDFSNGSADPGKDILSRDYSWDEEGELEE